MLHQLCPGRGRQFGIFLPWLDPLKNSTDSWLPCFSLFLRLPSTLHNQLIDVSCWQWIKNFWIQPKLSPKSCPSVLVGHPPPFRLGAAAAWLSLSLAAVSWFRPETDGTRISKLLNLPRFGSDIIFPPLGAFNRHTDNSTFLHIRWNWKRSSSSKTNLVSLQPVPAGDKHSEPISKSQEIIRNHNRRPAAGTKQSCVSSPDPWPHFAVAQIGSYEETGNYRCPGLSSNCIMLPSLKT